MTQTKKAPGGAGTFLRFAWQQLANRKAARAGLDSPPIFGSIAKVLRVSALPGDSTLQVEELTVVASDAHWRGSGIQLRRGQIFRVYADGVVWLSKLLSIGASPGTALWMRIGRTGPLRKARGRETKLEGWADGELAFCLKPPGEWASESGDFDPSVPRTGAAGRVKIVVAVSPASVAAEGDGSHSQAPPKGWSYLWRIGEGAIYGDAQDGGKPCIHVHTHGDVGILQYSIEAPLDASATLEWRWLVDHLPSALPEHIQPTHDYLSIAVEFENGQDLTYYWSAELPVDTVFKCPLAWWSERETHWVVRSGGKELGQWLSEKRNLKSDYEQAIGGPLPSKVVRIWLIANSVFQRRHGEAKFADIVLSASGAAQRIV